MAQMPEHYYSPSMEMNFSFVPGKAIFFDAELHGSNANPAAVVNKQKLELTLIDDFYVASNPIVDPKTNNPTMFSFLDALSACNGYSLDDGLSKCYNINLLGTSKKQYFDIEFEVYKVTVNPNSTGYRLPYLSEMAILAHSNKKIFKERYGSIYTKILNPHFPLKSSANMWLHDHNIVQLVQFTNQNLPRYQEILDLNKSVLPGIYRHPNTKNTLIFAHKISGPAVMKHDFYGFRTFRLSVYNPFLFVSSPDTDKEPYINKPVAGIIPIKNIPSKQ